MAGWTDDSARELKERAAAYDRQRTAGLVDDFVAHVRICSGLYPADEARRLLGALKNKRFFDLLGTAAEALIESGQDAPAIRKLLAQGLIEQGRLVAARDGLLRLEEDTRGDVVENAEARGLLGRVHKQLYVREPQADRGRRTRHITTAIEWYASAYVTDPDANYWHGINTVACLMRARRDGLDVTSPLDPAATAKAALKVVNAGASPGAWQLATAMEACVALGETNEALAWAHKYVASKDADAFELGSSLRQLKEVWQLTPSAEPGASLITLLEANLLQREGGRVQGTPADLQSMAKVADMLNLEGRFAGEEFTKIRFLAMAIARSNLVASVSNRFGDRVGSAFVVPGDRLHPSLSPSPVLVTNSHVLGGPAPIGKKAVPVTEAIIRFENIGPEQYFCKGQLLFTSPHSELDVSLVALCRDRQLDAITKLGDHEPLTWTAPPEEKDGRRVYVVGHADGGEIAVSLEGNKLLDYDARRLHYRSATAEGNSGSPVFDDTWELIGLHHGGSATMPRLDGGGVYEANEGFRLDAISTAYGAWRAAR